MEEKKKALYRQMNMPVPERICATLVISFMAIVEKNLFLVRGDGSVLICPMWKGRLHKIYWKNRVYKC